MGRQGRQALKYVVIYGMIWLTLAQLNAVASLASLFFPMWWIFVYFPAMQHSAKLGLPVTLVAGVFFESQFPPLRGLLLPVMLAVFLLLSYQRSQSFERRKGALLMMASVVHWVLVAVPSALLWFFERVPEFEGFWWRVLQDAVCGQILLFLVFPLLSLLWLLVDGHAPGEED